MLLEKHTVPLVQLTLVVRTGSVRDPRGREGLASMTAALMTRGAGSRDALALAEEVDYLGASLTAEAGRHTSSVSLFVPRARLEQALALMADVILRPAFPDSELNRERTSRLTTLMQWRSSPEILADLLLDRALFGSAHPYGRPVLGTREGMTAIRCEDLVAFHSRYYHAANASMIAVGDITMEELRPMLGHVFGDWPARAEVPGNIPPMRHMSARRVVLLDQPEASQTQLRVGCVGAPRMTEDYYALMVLNTVLGGSFSSRLNTNLREQHGYGYGAGSQFDFRLLPGPFVIWSAIESSVTDSALIEVFNELARIREPVPALELDRAKHYLALSYPANFQTISSTAVQLDEMATYGLEEDYFSHYIDSILAPTAEELQLAAERYLDPGRMVIVLVGDRRVIEEPARALQLGPLEILGIDEILPPAPEVPGASEKQ